MSARPRSLKGTFAVTFWAQRTLGNWPLGERFKNIRAMFGSLIDVLCISVTHTFIQPRSFFLTVIDCLFSLALTFHQSQGRWNTVPPRRQPSSLHSILFKPITYILPYATSVLCISTAHTLIHHQFCWPLLSIRIRMVILCVCVYVLLNLNRSDCDGDSLMLDPDWTMICFLYCQFVC